MKKAELKTEARNPGRVLGRVLAEELEQVRGGFPGVLQATGGQTRDSHGHPDLTGGSPGQTDGD